MGIVEQAYETIFPALTEGVAILDATGRVLACNRSAERILGFPEGQLTGSTWTELGISAIHEDGAPFPGETHPPIVTLQTGQPLTGVIMGLPKPDGGITWLSVNTRVVSEPGSPRRVVSTLTDITPWRSAGQARVESTPARKEDEESLRLSESRYRSLFDNSLDAVFLTDANGDIHAANPAACEMFGMTEQEIRSAGGQGLTDNDDPRLLPANAARQAAGHVRAELTFVAKGGRKFEGEISSAIVGEGQLAFVIVRDISERKRAEDALRDSEERFAAFMSNLPAAAFVKEKNGRILFVNRYLRDFAQLKDWEGRTTRELFEGEPGLQMEENDRRALDEGLLRTTESVADSSGGSRTFDTIKFPIHLGSGETLLGGISVDITEQVCTEEALREAFQFNRQVIDNARDGVVVYGPDLRYRLWNRFMEEMTGVAAKDVLGRLPNDVFPFLNQAGVVERLEIALAGEHPPPADFPWAVADREGWASDVSGPLRNSAGEIVGVIGTVRDVTQRKRVETELERANQTMSMALRAGRAGAWELNVETGELLWTREYRELLGVEPAFVPTLEAFLGMVHPEDREPLKASIQHSIADPAVFQDQFRILLSDGLHWMERRGFVKCNEDGHPARIIGITSDITALKQTECALRESEKSYRALVEGMPDAVMRFNRQGQHLFVSENVKELVDLSAQQFLGKTHRELGFPESMCAYWEESIAGVFDKGTPIETEFTLDGKRGPTVFNWRLVPERGDTGEVQSVLSISRDISAYRRLEQDYTTLFREMMDSFALHEVIRDSRGNPVDYRFLAVNPAFERATGLKAEEITGKTVAEVLPAADRQWIESYAEVVTTGEPITFHRFSEESGKHFEVKAFRSAPDRFVTIFADVTESKRAAQDLARTNLRLNLAAASGRLGIWEWEITSGALIWDDRMFELYGVAKEEFSPNHEAWMGLLHPDDRARAVEAIEEATSGEWPYDVEFRVVDPAGATRHIKADGLTIRDAGGRAVRMIGLNRDITAGKLAEEERKRLQVQLAHAQKMESVGRLAGGVAHDFNNLLTIINGYSKMALDGLGAGDPLRDEIGEIHQAGERAAGLTRQLLAFSRKQILQPRCLNLNTVIGEMQSMLRRLVGEDVDMRFKRSDVSPKVHADRHQLEQVMMNLAVNARDAMPSGGRLLIETGLLEKSGDEEPGARPVRFAMLSVTDTGGGMDEATRQRIFEPFFTTKGAGQGTGLGLAIVQGIIAQSGGNIEVFSQPGSGTCFRIYLPAVVGVQVPQEQGIADRPMGGSECILVVEDQAEVRRFASAALKSYGYSVIQAASAEEALTICCREKAPVDLVLTDVVMPVTSGRELSERLLEVRPGLSVLFMSGYTDNVMVNHGVLQGGINFVQKPFSPAELAAKVRCGSRRSGAPRPQPGG